jgi:hypothetical protein
MRNPAQTQKSSLAWAEIEPVLPLPADQGIVPAFSSPLPEKGLTLAAYAEGFHDEL